MFDLRPLCVTERQNIDDWTAAASLGLEHEPYNFSQLRHITAPSALGQSCLPVSIPMEFHQARWMKNNYTICNRGPFPFTKRGSFLERDCHLFHTQPVLPNIHKNLQVRKTPLLCIGFITQVKAITMRHLSYTVTQINVSFVVFYFTIFRQSN